MTSAAFTTFNSISHIFLIFMVFEKKFSVLQTIYRIKEEFPFSFYAAFFKGNLLNKLSWV